MCNDLLSTPKGVLPYKTDEDAWWLFWMGGTPLKK